MKTILLESNFKIAVLILVAYVVSTHLSCLIEF